MIVDTEAPALEDVKKGIKFMQEFLEQEKVSPSGHRLTSQDKTVLVHCKGGRGRAATMVLCYYISIGVCAKEALAAMRQKRKVVVATIANYSVVKSISEMYKKD